MPGSGPDPSRRTFLAGLAGVAIVGVATGGAILFDREDTAVASPATTSPASASPGAPSASASSPASTSSASTSKAAEANTYKDGKYTETGDYDSPAGGETVTVTVTLAADVITATSATGSASSGPSSQYQEQFISGYSAEVVGRDIDSVSLSRVSGSSLTSGGFDAALTKIKSDAKA